MKRFKWLLLWGVAILVAGCGNEPDPDGGGNVKPDQEVPDPTGTVMLSMRNDDDTSLNGLYIGKDDNFHGNGWTIASIGKVKGLGNVASIPLVGWASKVAVTPGYGYVAYDKYDDVYYRIYVVDYMEGATTGGIIGANIKYQKPFRGLDEEISLQQNKVMFSTSGGLEQIVFDNQSIVPFKVTSSAEWCKVQKASTRDMSFLYDAVAIACDETYAAEEAKATVTIETLFGKKKEIEVTRAGYGEFIQISQSELDFGFQAGNDSRSISVYTNIVPKDIKVSSNADWLKAAMSGRKYKPTREIRSIEGQPVTRASLENPVNTEMIVSVDGYVGSEAREGIITLSYGTAKSELKVTQSGSNFSIEQHSFSFDGKSTSAQSQSCTWSGYLNSYYLSAKPVNENDTWVKASFSGSKFTVTVQPNLLEAERKAIMKIYYTQGNTSRELDEIEVTQKGTPVEDSYLYFESPATNYTISLPTMKEGAKITSSADWCSATPNGSNIVVRVTAAAENRSAVISVEGVSSKIYVSQSKYKVGDTYDEDGISGTVYSMKDGAGRIYKEFLDNYNKPLLYTWSKETIDIVGAYNSDDGRENMKAIKAIPGWKDLYPAFAAVDALNVNGITGWYLPAKSEISTFTNIWTSTQFSSSKAYYYDGNYYPPKADTKLKGDKLKIVAMHRFSYDFTKK